MAQTLLVLNTGGSYQGERPEKTHQMAGLANEKPMQSLGKLTVSELFLKYQRITPDCKMAFNVCLLEVRNDLRSQQNK